MKRVSLGLLTALTLSTIGFANASILKNETNPIKEKKNETQQKKEQKEEKETFCTKQCSRVIGGVTYTTEAGNFLTSCETAQTRCEKKLDKLSTLESN